MGKKKNDLGFVVLALFIVGCATRAPPPIYYSPAKDHDLGVAAMSSNGELAAVADWEAIWLLDTNTASTVQVFSQSNRCSSESGWSPRYGIDNSLRFVGDDLIASTGMYGTITIWKAGNPCPIETLNIPELEGYPISLAWSKATGQMAVGDDNGTIVLLDPVATGGYAHKTVDTLDGPVLDLLFSKDGTYLAAAGVHSEVLIWFASTLEKAGSLPVEGAVRNMQLMPEKRTLLVTADELKLWTFLSEEEASKLENPDMGGQKAAAVGLGILIFPVVLTYWPAYKIGEAATPYDESSRVWCDRIAILSPDARYLVDRHPGVMKVYVVKVFRTATVRI